MERARVVSGRFWPMALLALLSAGGCATFQDETPNSRDDTAKWGEMNRPVKLGGGFGGVTPEAQQIERNLGIR